MKCTYCKKKIDIGKEIEDWDKAYGKEAECPIYIGIYCPNCGHAPYCIWIEEAEEKKIKGGEALDGKEVVFPEPKKYKKPPKVNQYLPQIKK